MTTESIENTEDKKDTVTISKSSYNRLVERDGFLSALEAAGVDNWSGYDCAQDMIND